jgi:hypothetical protein
MWIKKSMMTHGGMLWGAALYNNGAFPLKDAQFGKVTAATDRFRSSSRIRRRPSMRP